MEHTRTDPLLVLTYLLLLLLLLNGLLLYPWADMVVEQRLAGEGQAATTARRVVC